MISSLNVFLINMTTPCKKCPPDGYKLVKLKTCYYQLGWFTLDDKIYMRIAVANSLKQLPSKKAQAGYGYKVNWMGKPEELKV